MTGTDDLPDIADVLGRFLQRVPVGQQPLLIALAERLAAGRYRAWADAVDDAGMKALLAACAAREEEVAVRIEHLHPDAAAIQRTILEANPDLQALGDALFAPYPLDQQWRLQVRAERLGAATWQSFARRQDDARARDALLACAALEEANACALEALLSGGTASKGRISPARRS